MIPGPAHLYGCPHCGKTKSMISLISGNTLDNETWSDGKAIYPMHPQLSSIQKCSACGRYSFLDSWKDTGKETDKSYGTTGHLTYSQAKEAYITLSTLPCLNPKYLNKISLYFIHAYNDKFIRPKCLNSIRDRQNDFINSNIHLTRYRNDASYKLDSPDDDDVELYRAASINAINTFDDTTGDVILKAELHRQLGNFEQAYEILVKIPESKKSQNFVNALLYHIAQQNADIFPLSINGMSIDYEHCENFQDLILGDTVAKKEKRRAKQCKMMTKYMETLPQDIVQDITTDAHGGVYEHHSRTLLRLIGPSPQIYLTEAGTRNIGNYACYRNLLLRAIRCADSVKNIGIKAFYGCENLLSFTIMYADIESIEDYAFMNCKSITSLQFGSNLKYLGRSVFAGMDNLTSITLSEGIECIPEFTFSDCRSLSSINIPTTVTKIQSYAFQHTAITSIVIPPSVNIITKRAFSGTFALNTIYFQGIVENIASEAFDESGLKKIIVPKTTKYYYEQLFPNLEIETFKDTANTKPWYRFLT